MSAGVMFGMYLTMGVAWCAWIFDYNKQKMDQSVSDVINNGSCPKSWYKPIAAISYIAAFIWCTVLWPRYVIITIIKIFRRKKR